MTSTLVISGQSGKVLKGLHISTTSGDCLQINDSTDITLEDSEIGPCGGNAVVISGGSGMKIHDSYLHPETQSTGCCDHNDGVFANGTNDLDIRGNIIAYGEANIEASNSKGVTVSGNFLLNPRNGGSRGQNFQSWNGCSNVLVENNYALSSLDTTKYLYPEHQEDSINFGVTDGIIARNNYITGGHSGSGCGLIADDAANSVQFIGNVLVDTGQCGIGIADGTNQVVQNNKILNRTPVAGGGNTAIYVWKQYDGACGPTSLSGNIASQKKPDGTQSGYWDGGGCDPVTEMNDTWDDAAVAMLTPVEDKLPPPSIPPGPASCVAVSPYTNR